MISWHDSETVLIWDGSLWDIFVHRTNMMDWQRTLDEFKNRNYKVVYSVSGKEQTLTSASDIFAMDASLLPSLFVFVGGTSFNTYFIKVEEIVFDVSPKNIYNQESLNTVLDFMTVLGNSTKKDVGLSPDNLYEYAFVTYLTSIKKFVMNKGLIADGTGD